MSKPQDFAGQKKSTRRSRVGRVILVAASLALLCALIFLGLLWRPSGLYVGSKKFSLNVATLAPKGPFADEGFWIHDGWDGPNDFTHGQLYGLKFGNRLIRLDILEDPVAAIRRHLPKTVPGLLQAFSSKDYLVKKCAGEALVKMGPSAQSALSVLLDRYQQGDEDAEWVILELAKSASASAVPPLSAALTDAHQRIRQKAAEALGEIGAGAVASVPRLQNLLHDSAPDVVITSSLSLRKIDKRDHGEVTALIGLLTNKDPQIAGRDVFALGEFGAAAAAAVPTLMTTIEDGDPQMPGLVARTLGLIGPAARPAIPRIISLLQSDNPQTLMFSMEALGRLGEFAKAAIPELLDLAEKKEQMVGAIAALSSMGGDALPGLVDLYRHGTNDQYLWVARAFRAQGAHASAAVPTLMADLQSDRSQRVTTAAWTLGCIGDKAKAAVPRLAELIQDSDPQLRVLAAEALWRIDQQTNAVLRVMIGELSDWSKNPQALISQTTLGFFQPREETAAEVVGEIGPVASGAIPFLQKMSRSSYDSNKEAAAKALNKIARQGL
jgi:HEAT repeat protein